MRSYKRTSSVQQENMSDILSLKKQKCQPSSNALVKPEKCSPPVSDAVKLKCLPSTSNTICQPTASADASSALLSSTNISNQQLMIHPDNLDHMFNLNSCTSVNINVNINSKS